MFEAKFLSYINAVFDEPKAAEIEEAMQFKIWVTEPGLPPVQNDFTTKALNESSDLADAYISLNG